MLSGKVPPGPVGVPATVAVPSPLSVKVKPAGNVPVSVMAAVGEPVVVTVKVPAEPIVNCAWFALVIAGGCWTVMVRVWVAFGLIPLLAVTVIGKCRPRSACRPRSRCHHRCR